MKIEEVELLLIEDNPYEAELAIRNLKKHKLANRMIHLEDGEEALDFMFARGKYAKNDKTMLNPKLILLDLNLPKISGKEILKEIKSDKHTKNFPVVILTSSADLPDIKDCYELGANSYITKPVSFDDFSELIKDLGMYWMIVNKTN